MNKDDWFGLTAGSEGVIGNSIAEEEGSAIMGAVVAAAAGTGEGMVGTDTSTATATGMSTGAANTFMLTATACWG